MAVLKAKKRCLKAVFALPHSFSVFPFVSCSVRLLTAPTEDQGKLFAVLTELKAEGGCAVTQAIKTAMVSGSVKLRWEDSRGLVANPSIHSLSCCLFVVVLLFFSFSAGSQASQEQERRAEDRRVCGQPRR